MAEKAIVQRLENISFGTGSWVFSVACMVTDGGSGLMLTVGATSADWLSDVQWRNLIRDEIKVQALAQLDVVIDEVVMLDFTILSV